MIKRLTSLLSNQTSKTDAELLKEASSSAQLTIRQDMIFWEEDGIEEAQPLLNNGTIEL